MGIDYVLLVEGALAPDLPVRSAISASGNERTGCTKIAVHFVGGGTRSRDAEMAR